MPTQKRRQPRAYEVVNIYPTYANEEEQKGDQEKLYRELETMALMRGFSSSYEYIQKVFNIENQGAV